MTSLPQHILVLFSCCCCRFAALSASLRFPLRFSSYHYPRDSLISWTSLSFSQRGGQENSGARMSIESSERETEEAPALLFKISGTHRKKERKHMLGEKEAKRGAIFSHIGHLVSSAFWQGSSSHFSLSTTTYRQSISSY